MNQNVTPSTTAAATFKFASGRVAKKCACGTQFLAERPQHDKCRGCHIKVRKEADSKAANLRAIEDRKAEAAASIAALKEAFFQNALPKSAAVSRNGRQVVVSWMGRSTTFYVN